MLSKKVSFLALKIALSSVKSNYKEISLLKLECYVQNQNCCLEKKCLKIHL